MSEFGITNALDFNQSASYVVYLLVLIYNSLMRYIVEHFFIHLLAICIFFGEVFDHLSIFSGFVSFNWGLAMMSRLILNSES
jgi:hypothetical protein